MLPSDNRFSGTRHIEFISLLKIACFKSRSVELIKVVINLVLRVTKEKLKKSMLYWQIQLWLKVSLKFFVCYPFSMFFQYFLLTAHHEIPERRNPRKLFNRLENSVRGPNIEAHSLVLCPLVFSKFSIDSIIPASSTSPIRNWIPL